jgi:hypothetical protein
MATRIDDDNPTLYALARRWGTYPDLLEGLCITFGFEVLRAGGVRRVKGRDVADLEKRLGVWRARLKMPKLARLTKRTNDDAITSPDRPRRRRRRR